VELVIIPAVAAVKLEKSVVIPELIPGGGIYGGAVKKKLTLSAK
jgi:hypothetical protein